MDYKALWELAQKIGLRESHLLYPPGKHEMRKQVAHEIALNKYIFMTTKNNTTKEVLQLALDFAMKAPRNHPKNRQAGKRFARGAS